MRAPVADQAKTPKATAVLPDVSLLSLLFLLLLHPPVLGPAICYFFSSCSSAAQGSPVKKRGVGRWRLSEEGRREAEQDQQRAGAAAAGFESSPLRSNHNPFSPDGDGRGRGSAGGGQVTLGVCVLHCVVSSVFVAFLLLFCSVSRRVVIYPFLLFALV